MRRAAGLVSLVLACSGESSSREEFVAGYCELVRPCCAQAHLPTDGRQCQALVDAFTPRASFDPQAAASCLGAMRKMQLCNGGPPVDPTACDGVFAGRERTGTKQPGEHHDECALAPEGTALCADQFDGLARTRICQVQFRGQAGDGPWLFTIPEVPTAFPYPPVLGGPVVVVAYTASFPAQPPRPSAGRTLPPGRRRLLLPGQLHLHEAQAGWRDLPGGSACVNTAYCHPTERVCHDRQGPGAPCQPDRVREQTCLDGSFCDPTTSSCSAQVDVGQPCSQDSQCRSYTCLNQRCARNDLDDLAAEGADVSASDAPLGTPISTRTANLFPSREPRRVSNG
jgi:hypothetical protein